ncbi:hypothetical protein [endosymbiont 'TC1' of Trimyema compressum]|uniref:hypothetical protein n=1 Tax=endosymbiont 'TC1' of Trimyema compressum TaxID=243899 RepID=UPI00155F0396|nr:hypothetical protein [endosymbiont 'TC1' of Trimyema compressum]
MSTYLKHVSLFPVYFFSICPTWEDGKVYTVDKALGRDRRAALKTGGQGMRYTCKIMGKISYLF